MALPYYGVRECRLDGFQSDTMLFPKRNEYTIILRGRNLRQLYFYVVGVSEQMIVFTEQPRWEWPRPGGAGPQSAPTARSAAPSATCRPAPRA